ncbi:MAG TPA: DNA replication/repair protein RecF [Clostridiaceae bacterium]|nr:DNA replication/repair protein RecF [Clostridiaceae bacterium]
MRITSVELKNFRNYSQLYQDFYPGAQILYGNNAQGKTNILEAIYLCTCARSHRTGRDAELVQQGKSDYDVRVKFVTDKNLEEEIRIHYLMPVSNDPLRTRPIRHIYYNGVRLERVSDMMGIFNAVIFAPEDLQIIKDGPSARRRFLDLLISQIYPSYFRDISQYQHLLIQRNNLLKKLRQKNANTEVNNSYNLHLQVWDEQIARCATRIIMRRQKVTDEICRLANDSILQIAGAKEKLSIRYRSSVSIANTMDAEEFNHIFLNRLQEQTNDDIIRGNTSVGPHRDDLILSLNEIEVRPYASQGQQRSVALALKLAELLLLRQKTGENPVLLLDDVMSELDSDRRYRLLQTIEGHQSFLTCTDLSQVLIDSDKESLSGFVGEYNLFEVNQAHITRVDTIFK